MYKAAIRDKDGNITEQLVYEKISSSSIKYIDMSEDFIGRCLGDARSFGIDEVVCLVPLSRMLKLQERVSIKDVLKRYYDDLHQLLNVKDLYIGDIGIVANSKSTLN